MTFVTTRSSTASWSRRPCRSDGRAGSGRDVRGRQKRGRGAGLGALVLAVAFLLGPAARARAAQVAVIPDEEGGSCRVRGVFVVPVTPAVGGGVLTDYEGIGKFVPSVRESRIEPQADGRQLLRQDAVGSMMFIHRRVHVLLELEEDRERRISFHDVLGKDFRAYSGEWRDGSDFPLSPGGYQRGGRAPSALMRGVCRRGTRRGSGGRPAPGGAGMSRR